MTNSVVVPLQKVCMRLHNDSLLHSASDLNSFLGCAHAVALNLRALDDPTLRAQRAQDDDSARLVQDAGHAHEGDYLTRLKAAGPVAEIAAFGSIERRAVATEAAMREGAAVIYQAAFLGAPWHGFADFLRRVNTPSALGDWSYEAVDTKLARSPKPSHVLQLGVYSDLIEGVQQARPHGMHLVLGDRREASFRAVEFRHTLDVAKARYLDFIATGAQGSGRQSCRSRRTADTQALSRLRQAG